MGNTSGEKILMKFSRVKHQYERLARELHRVLDEDPTFPIRAVYTVKHRLKSEARLLEKVKDSNSRKYKKGAKINESTLQDRIEDLLGIRIVCFRLSDQERLKIYIDSLRKEKVLRIVRGPTEKKTFLIKPGGKEASDIQYSGYSSTHYVVGLGSRLRPSEELASLKAELQLRTIFEEAWGEIDHKYQYEKTRAGGNVPTHISNGFRDLALYMLACSRQADHLCEEVELLPHETRKKTSGRRRKSAKPAKAETKIEQVATVAATSKGLAQILRTKIGFAPSDRTLAYCDRRLQEHAFFVGGFTLDSFEAAFNDNIIKRFKEIYLQELEKEPFVDAAQRDLDVVPLLNYTIFSTVRSPEVADTGLRSALRSRPGQSPW
jgi:putative GTP pyrophosphokinase